MSRVSPVFNRKKYKNDNDERGKTPPAGTAVVMIDTVTAVYEEEYCSERCDVLFRLK